MEENSVHITCLPEELMGLILQKTSYRDVLNFGYTCKHFNELVNTNQWIWKVFLSKVLPPKIACIVTKYGNGNWLNEIKRYFAVKKEILEELFLLSPKLYGRTDEIRLKDLQIFFKIGLTYNSNYYYVIYILLDFIKGSKFNSFEVDDIKQRNLTHLYYANIVVRFLLHTFLAVKWAHDYNNNELTPDVVLNFFVQWIDPFKVCSETYFGEKISEMVRQIEGLFPDDPHVKTLPEKVAQGLVDGLDVLKAINDIIHIRQLKMTIIDVDVYEQGTVEKKNPIKTAVEYQTVSRKCGVQCDLYAFQNYLFLEWQSPRNEIYRIDLQTGSISLQSVCSHASKDFRDKNQYNPVAFLRHNVVDFMHQMLNVQDLSTQNAKRLKDFINNSNKIQNVYRDFLPNATRLMDFESDPDLAKPITLEYLHPSHMAVIEKLSRIDNSYSIPPLIRDLEIKLHDPKVMYAVGMVCYHKKLGYICVIQDWDTQYTPVGQKRVDIKMLEHGIMQPFYSVMPLDQNERYVAQENLVHIDHPSRLNNLEDTLGKAFTHFDGYAYVPNEEKLMEYPEDGPIREMYHSRQQYAHRSVLPLLELFKM